MKTNRKRVQLKKIKSGGVDNYIAECPKEAQDTLRAMRTAIREVVPDAVETVSYFGMPGYSYEGYDYNGMFAWFSFKAPFVRLHIRPQALTEYAEELARFAKTKAIVNFDINKKIPKILIKKLVRASLKDMKAT